MSIEMFLSLIFYPPHTTITITGIMLGNVYTYNLNSIVNIIIMSKSYLIIRIYKYFSVWTSQIATSICNKHNIAANVSFAIKSELKNRPNVNDNNLLFLYNINMYLFFKSI